VTREVTGVGVLDKHGPVGVLRAVVIAPKVRRLTHGSLLATQLLKRAHYERVLNVYALGLVPEFLDALGFAEMQRADVPKQVLALPGLAGATVPIFEIAPRVDGAIRTRSRRYPKTCTGPAPSRHPRVGKSACDAWASSVYAARGAARVSSARRSAGVAQSSAWCGR
jgi:hypothetical protein